MLKMGWFYRCYGDIRNLGDFLELQFVKRWPIQPIIELKNALMKMKMPSKTKLQNTWDELKEFQSKNFEKYGVRLP
ncbi:MAG: hypothetical protein OXC02_00190 [Rhodobacteraceae bacterium]|nr:hypothetical protein [Paracoccaceae bacterium]